MHDVRVVGSVFKSELLIGSNIEINLPIDTKIELNLPTHGLVFASRLIRLNYKLTPVPRNLIEVDIDTLLRYIMNKKEAVYEKVVAEFLLLIGASVDKETIPHNIGKGAREDPSYITSITMAGNRATANGNSTKLVDGYINTTKNVPTGCPDKMIGCATAHFKRKYIRDPVKKNLIDTINTTKISYSDLLEKWKNYYDEVFIKKKEEMITNTLDKHGDLFPLWDIISKDEVQSTQNMFYTMDKYEYDWNGPDGNPYFISEGIIAKRNDSRS
jgi:hypothetical protein